MFFIECQKYRNGISTVEFVSQYSHEIGLQKSKHISG